ncbi:DRAP deaminase [Viridothelium virens]|uniref:Pseudouridine synthase n=1 Tax=Viridothelium virens TaxID=1048519 RepID=A0A6A6HPU4_VIRVR|nr:DRAP deaminase [Viridothelium virens]
MAVTISEPLQVQPESFPSPPAVAITPCDPWPRPYYLDGDLRRVRPYHYTYNTYCKERWRGRELLEIFSSEFRDRPVEYYKDAIEAGKVVVNGRQAAVYQPVKNGDVISHTLHRHEPPVTAKPIGIVHEDNDMIVINKPAGVPVHPAGRYNYNSIVEIMRADRGYNWNPRPCNRLDRLTSGIMFVAKHPQAADRLTLQIRGREVKKEYIARVKGEFPEGEIICEQPILQISPKLGLNRVRAKGKEARTVFRRLAHYPPRGIQEEKNGTNAGIPNRVDGIDPEKEKGRSWKSKEGYSIVRCLPLTGRTHQLRVHLQFLGHPISNDPIYCNQRVFGQDLACGDDKSDDDEDVMARLSRMGKDQVAEAVAYHDEMVEDYNKRKAEKLSGETCEICGTQLYTDPGSHELGIYLHARRYACIGGSWEYETPLPDWALPPAGMSGPVETTPETDPIKTAMERLDIRDSTDSKFSESLGSG